MKKKESRFFKQIKDAKLEREVELVYKKGINSYYPESTISNPYGSDGYIEYNLPQFKKKKFALLMEFKFNENLISNMGKAKVLVQVIYYLKKFEIDGKRQPDVILIADKYNAFIVHYNKIKDYLDKELDWEIAPSKASDNNSQIVYELANDKEINSLYTYMVDENFSFKTVVDDINSLVTGTQRKVRITMYNIEGIFDYFIINVVKDSSKINANDLVNIFISMIINPDEVYKHPKKNTLVVKSSGREISINGDSYRSFMSYFESDSYKPSEKEKFTEIADRLIEDTNRRFRGEFYTPTVWVDYVHSKLSSCLGDDWKEKYVVWDCAWGTGNLTRDYCFGNLYCSTLNNSDLLMGERYNKEACKFQYDFLNDDVDMLFKNIELIKSMCKMPTDLLNHFMNDDPIVFLINPPYATASNGKSKVLKSKDGTADTQINKIMKKNKIGNSAQQLYAQFIYRIMMMKKAFNLSNVKIAIFSPALYISGPSFIGLRKEFLNEFKFMDGILFNAGHFSNVKASWAIDFAIWTNGQNIDKENFIHSITDINEQGQIQEIDKKNVYNLDYSLKCSDWIKNEKDNQQKEIITMKSALNIGDKLEKANENSLGFLINDSNNVYANAQGVYIMSSKITRHIKTTCITPNNFEDCMSLFAARNLIKANWINQKDEYRVPDIILKEYKEWVLDSVVYSIFNISSNQVSLRNIQFNQKNFNIFNEFFFMSNNEIKQLADKYRNDEVYSDSKNYNSERFVYEYLKDKKLSVEAINLLNYCKKMVDVTFMYRDIVNRDNPEYNLNTWDAGWYQIKLILKKYYKNEYKQFNDIYSKLEDKMINQVYKLGFLK